MIVIGSANRSTEYVPASSFPLPIGVATVRAVDPVAALAPVPAVAPVARDVAPLESDAPVSDGAEPPDVEPPLQAAATSMTSATASVRRERTGTPSRAEARSPLTFAQPGGSR